MYIHIPYIQYLFFNNLSLQKILNSLLYYEIKTLLYILIANFIIKNIKNVDWDFQFCF